MSDFITLIDHHTPTGILLLIVGYLALPGVALRGVLFFYPRSDRERRDEILAEFQDVPGTDRPGYVLDQLRVLVLTSLWPRARRYPVVLTMSTLALTTGILVLATPTTATRPSSLDWIYSPSAFHRMPPALNAAVLFTVGGLVWLGRRWSGFRLLDSYFLGTHTPFRYRRFTWTLLIIFGLPVLGSVAAVVMVAMMCVHNHLSVVATAIGIAGYLTYPVLFGVMLVRTIKTLRHDRDDEGPVLPASTTTTTTTRPV